MFIVKAAAFISFLGLGLFQMLIIAEALDRLGLHWFIANTIGFFSGYFPFIGPTAATWAATYVLNWSWITAGSIFFSPYIAFLLFMAFSLVTERK
jgi:hypothetical protein